MSITERLQQLDWKEITCGLWERGYAKTSKVLAADECDQLVSLYNDETKFRSYVDMARYEFGMGEYKYFADPLPPIIQELRTRTYSHLVSTANRWVEALSLQHRFPAHLGAFLKDCQRNGQTKPAVLLLQYVEGGYNCLHQDLLGELAFPFQITCLLSRRNLDYTGGEFLLIKERPRTAQARGEVIYSEQGELVFFATANMPVAGKRGYHRVKIRHGVSRLVSGQRHSLGIVLHNSK